MGSLGPDYRCPLCGRTGYGGYIPDPLGFGICTESDNDRDCLSRFMDGEDPVDIVSAALKSVLCSHKLAERWICRAATLFLVPDVDG